MKDLLHRFGQRIRELRSQRGWSQEEFADVCGVHRTYMGHVERGEKNVSFGSIVRVTNALSINLSELFAGLETGEPTTGAKRKRGISGQSGLDRNRVLREVAVLERAIRTLRELALPEDTGLSPKAEARLSRRRGRKSH